jgi:ATP synthase I subunit
MAQETVQYMSTLNNAPSSESGPEVVRPDAVERRVWRNILGLVALSTVAAIVIVDLRFALGVAVGGGLALLNYRWLNSSLKAILEVGSEKTPPGTSIKFIVRWLAIAAVAWAANKTGYVDAVGILAGLFAPAVAIMIEAAYVTIRTIAADKGEQ